jgi:hypothetical protein
MHSKLAFGISLTLFKNVYFPQLQQWHIYVYSLFARSSWNWRKVWSVFQLWNYYMHGYDKSSLLRHHANSGVSSIFIHIGSIFKIYNCVKNLLKCFVLNYSEMPVNLHISPKNYAFDLHLSLPKFKFSNLITTWYNKQILTIIETSVLNDRLHYLLSFV